MFRSFGTAILIAGCWLGVPGAGTAAESPARLAGADERALDPPPRGEQAAARAAVQELSREFERLLVTFQPVRASRLGLDAGEADLGPSSRAETEAALRAESRLVARLDSLAVHLASRQDRFDVALMLHDLRRQRFEHDTLRVWEEDASYAIDLVSGGIFRVASRDDLPPRRRALLLMKRQTQVPRFLNNALGRLQRVTPAHVERAEDQIAGLERFMDGQVPVVIAQLEDPLLATELHAANEEALYALRRFRRGLKERLGEAADSLWVFGPERLVGYLRATEGIEATVPELVMTAENELEWIETRLTELAARVDSTYTAADLMNTVAADHPSPVTLLVDVERALGEARAFLAAHGWPDSLLSGPPIRVRPSPPSARWSNASLAVPGPFDAWDRSPIFYVTVPGPRESAEERSELLRFLNRSFLLTLVAHEAYPGHYVQARAAAATPRRVRRMVASQAFLEGWAHYAEARLAEMGFRRDDARYEAAVLGSALRRAGRFRIALGLHAEGWSVDRAREFLVRRCHVEPIVARREAERGVLDPLYMSYTLGRLWLEDLREAVRAREGDAFDPLRFDFRLLEYGAPPLPLLRAMLLGSDIPIPSLAE